jgi:hypothetical protein
VFETLHEPADLGDWLAQPPLAAVVTVPVTARSSLRPRRSGRRSGTRPTPGRRSARSPPGR